MSDGISWKRLAAYAAFREWRWNRHQTIKEQKNHPRKPTGFGYPTCWAFLILASLVSLPVAVCLAAGGDIGLFMNVFWYCGIVFVTILMFRARYREKHV